MTKFAEFTAHSDGEPVFIAVDHIFAFYAHKAGGTIIDSPALDGSWRVKEDIARVIHLLMESGE